MLYYGKYRAIVTKVNDPDKMDRIKVKCPSVLGDYESAWCLPCFPIIIPKAWTDTNKPTDLIRMPKVGEAVWIEFEGGELSKPIWVGTWKR